MDKYEVLIIGSGEAGKYLAWSMARDGHRTALVERKLIGGACPNIACLPSKNIIYSAKVATLAKRAEEFGLDGGPLTTNMMGVLRRKQEMVAGLIKLNGDRFPASGAELIMGEASGVGERTIHVALNDGGSRELSADRLFLDLGTRASLPDVPGLAEAKPMTHVEALDLARLPEHLVVFGGGFVGLELAQALRRFGSRVTVIQRASQLAASEDEDVGKALHELFRDEGIDVLLDTKILEVKGLSGDHVRVLVENARGTQTIEASDLLVATGRVPNTQGMGIEKLGVELAPGGYIKVNERLETSAANVWALGDCAGSPKFTHVSYDDFRVVYENLNGGHRSTRNRLVPSCLFTDPELVRVGLNEKEARRLGINYRLATLPMAAVLRTRTVTEPRGFMKMLIAADSDDILGFTALSVEASELLSAVQTAMAGKLPYTVLRDAIFTHPTIAEGFVFLLATEPKKMEPLVRSTSV